MTDMSSAEFGSRNYRDDKLGAILNHLYGHSIPERALDRAILPGITKTPPARPAQPSGVFRRFRGHQKVLAAALVAPAIAVLIAVNVLPNPTSPQSASALTVLRRSAASLLPASGTAVRRVYSIRVSCRGQVRCPEAIGVVWTANLKGTFVTYQVMRLTDVSGPASKPTGERTSVVFPRNQGGMSTGGTMPPTLWLKSVHRQLGWPRNVEPVEYFQAWDVLAQLTDPQSMTGDWVRHMQRYLKSASKAGRLRRVVFEGSPSYQIRFPQQSPQATSGTIRVLYIDAHTYAVRGVKGLTCPVFGKTYSQVGRAGGTSIWVPIDCIAPRFVPKCFVDIGSSSTHVWVPRGCPRKLTPFRAVLTSTRSLGICQTPRSVFAWYFESHGGYAKRCKGGVPAVASSIDGAHTSVSGRAVAFEPASVSRHADAQNVNVNAKGTVAGVDLQSLGDSDWPQPRFSAARTAFNPLANVLSPANVSHLRLEWRMPRSYFSLSPVAADGLLYQPGARSYTALSLNTRTVTWRFIPGGFVYVSPTVGPRFVYAPVPAALYALDPQTGQPRWAFFPPRHGLISGTPVFSGSVVVIPVCPPQGNGPAHVAVSCSLYALSASTGRKLHVYSDPDGAVPAIDNGNLYLTARGTVRAISLSTGRRLWTFPPPNGAGGQYYGAGSDVAVANGIVYAAGDGSGAVYALDATTGRQLWWFRAGLQHGQLTDAAIAYGHVFVGQIGLGPKAGLYCLNGRTGHVLWHFKDNNGFEAGPSVANGVVYASDASFTVGTVFALDASNGQRLWSATVKHSGRAGNLVITNGLLLVEYGGRGVFAYGLPTR